MKHLVYICNKCGGVYSGITTECDCGSMEFTIRADRCSIVSAEGEQILALDDDGCWRKISQPTETERDLAICMNAIVDIKNAWEWWNIDTYDRGQDVVDEAIEHAMKLVTVEDMG